MIFDVRNHRHVIDYAGDLRRAVMSADVIAWCEATGVEVPNLRFDFEDWPDKPGYVRSYPLVMFTREADAVAFKVRWL